MTDIVERLRGGVTKWGGVDCAPDAILAAADEIERLRDIEAAYDLNQKNSYRAIMMWEEAHSKRASGIHEVELLTWLLDEIERLRAEIVLLEATGAEAADEIERLRLALRIIAGYEQCIDNLMSNGDVARAALTKKEKIMEPTLSLSEAKAVVATKIAPRVTEESIRAKIVSVEYLMPEIINDFCSEDMTTICKIRMTNGFVFIGHSTPASAANFDAEVGKRYAYENAFKQIWTHEGYLLRERLSER